MTLNPLAQIDLVTISAIVVIFLTTLLVLRRICFLPLIEVMERRAARIETARARKAEAEAALQSAREEAERVLAEAKAESERLLEKARAETAQLQGDTMTRARAEAEAILATGKGEMLALSQAQDARLAEELWSCVDRALTTMIGPVDETAVRLLVRRALAAKEAG